jgi:hypothetical protein
MKKIAYSLIALMITELVIAQPGADSAKTDKVKVIKDQRIDLLGKAQLDFNTTASRYVKGYRLFVLKSDNRDYAMKVRAYLLQTFPEEKVFMTYQSPFIKMKFGDFVDKKDAEKYRDMIIRGKVVTGNIYLVPEMVELKPDKLKDQDSK